MGRGQAVRQRVLVPLLGEGSMDNLERSVEDPYEEKTSYTFLGGHFLSTSIPMSQSLQLMFDPEEKEEIFEKKKHFFECYSDLSGLIPCPVLGSITPLFIPNSRIRPIRLIGLCASLITFLYPPVPRIQFDPSTAKSQFVESLRWLPYENIHFSMGIDGLSLFFVILTTFLIPICISVGWSGMRSFGKEYITASLIREFLMIAVSRMLDPLLFYVLPESVPIPMFKPPTGGPPSSSSRVWGSRQRKIKAAYQFFLYTSLGSVFMLLAIPLILLQTGTTDSQILLTTEFSERRQIFLWIASFASFAVKVPMVPVHIWLPEAHVEAPTAGSVILAGIPLKLGTYGFLRFSIPMFPEATLRSTPFIYTPSAIAIIYTPSTTSRQIDLKKIIAYSPVAHMNLEDLVGVEVYDVILEYSSMTRGERCATQNGSRHLCKKFRGLQISDTTIDPTERNDQKKKWSSIPPMSSHGLVPPALFLCVGVLYDRHQTRLVRYYGGSVSTMPNLPTISFSSTLANMSSPGTSSFLGEFPISVGAFQRNSLVATLAALGMILGAAYSLWLYNRAVSGNFKPDFLHKFSDPNGREVSIFLPFLPIVAIDVRSRREGRDLRKEKWVFMIESNLFKCAQPTGTVYDILRKAEFFKEFRVSFDKKESKNKNHE
ncbi:hypothetical protein IEQ34_024197 [Dendrobium chrysotoxum]|uniref:NADH-ubiquinone oxidoreductase chain 4 n=1 Tax=Dendrobium chrysotoxum TaxID=161865 RepID=A0AAV7FUE1_DENCH|nr:hypothetical protein IEQ34_024197 [Dendrobium chrysotoxum]